MKDARVSDPSGLQAVVEEHSDDRALLRLPDGRRVDIPRTLLSEDPSGSLRASVRFDQLSPAGDQNEEVFLEVEEHLAIETRDRETGRVRVTRRVETREEVVDEPGWQEHVEIERVPIGEYVSEVAGVREEDSVTVIPVYEEVLVVERRLLLKEEIRLRKTREDTRDRQRHSLRRTVVEIERTGDDQAQNAM